MSTKVQVAEKTKAEPSIYTIPLYRVIFHNDDVTHFDFVVAALMQFFEHELPSALKITAEVHKEGCGLAGVYALEHAEMRRDQAIEAARAYKFPLQISIEPEL